MSDRDGGPAFPFPAQYDGQGNPVHDSHAGLSLRDYFAAAALTGLCANMNVSRFTDVIADLAYEHADAMLAARSKPGKEER